MTDTIPKIHVRVKLFGHLRQLISESVIDMQVNTGTNVYDLIIALTKLYDEKLRQALLDSSGRLHGGIEIVCHQELLPARKLDSTILNENCDLYIVPMIEGGCQ